MALVQLARLSAMSSILMRSPEKFDHSQRVCNTAMCCFEGHEPRKDLLSLVVPAQVGGVELVCFLDEQGSGFLRSRKGLSAARCVSGQRS